MAMILCSPWRLYMSEKCTSGTKIKPQTNKTKKFIGFLFFLIVATGVFVFKIIYLRK